jgi:hypothetical protein
VFFYRVDIKDFIFYFLVGHEILSGGRFCRCGAFFSGFSPVLCRFVTLADALGTKIGYKLTPIYTYLPRKAFKYSFPGRHLAMWSWW